MATDLQELQNSLWEAADQLRANSELSAPEYSTPVLGLIFLRYADLRSHSVHERLKDKESARRGRCVHRRAVPPLRTDQLTLRPGRAERDPSVTMECDSHGMWQS